MADNMIIDDTESYERIAKDAATLPPCSYHVLNRTRYRAARCAVCKDGRKPLCWDAMQSHIKERFDALKKEAR